MKSFLILLFSLLFFSHSPENMYGSYRFADANMMLNLNSPDSYTLFVTEYAKRSGMVTSKEISRGTFEITADTLKLMEYNSNNAMTLHVASEEKLEVQHVKSLDKGDAFLCWSKYYDNGNPRFEGHWKKGKKHGTWVYYDEQGNVEKKVEYRRGKVKD